jgi:hypothetical protein
VASWWRSHLEKNRVTLVACASTHIQSTQRSPQPQLPQMIRGTGPKKSRSSRNAAPQPFAFIDSSSSTNPEYPRGDYGSRRSGSVCPRRGCCWQCPVAHRCLCRRSPSRLEVCGDPSATRSSFPHRAPEIHVHFFIHCFPDRILIPSPRPRAPRPSPPRRAARR